MKKLVFFLLVIATFLSRPVWAQDTIDLPAKNAIAVDLATGKILYEKEADQLVPVANLSRLITLYLVYEAVDQGQLTWNEEVKLSDYAYRMTHEPEVINIPMEARRYTVRDLTKAAIISASTSASIALAEKLAGDEEAFVDLMRQRLTDWGIKDHLIVNSSGVNNLYVGFNIYTGSGREEENSLSARSLAIISRKLIQDYPEVLELTQATRGDFGGQPIFTYNYLLQNMPHERPGATGLITGSSELAGSSLISLSPENHMEVLTVLLNVEGGDEEPTKRFEVANDFLDEIAKRFHLQKVMNSHTGLKDTEAPVLDGKSLTVPAVAQDDFFVVTTPETADKVKLKAVFPDKGNFAPIKEEDIVGKVVFDDQVLIGQGYLDEPPHMDLMADGTVERTNIFAVIWNHFVRYVLEYL